MPPHDAKRLAQEAREAREAREHAAGLPGSAPAFTPPELGRQHVIKGAHDDPLAIFREGLALARRAGMPWEQALGPTRSVALSVESDKREREQWTAALDATLAAWRSAYERRPTGCTL
jgi:hypothetical protein